MRRLAATVALLVLLLPDVSADRREDQAIADRLVQVARGHASDARSARTDLAHIETLLRAAVELDPTNTDSPFLLLELLSARGDDASVRDTLTALRGQLSTDVDVFTHWLDATLASHQSLEDRLGFLSQLSQSKMPREMEAVVALRRSQLDFQRLDRASAQRHLDRARGLGADPVSLARQALRLLPSDAADAERIALLLRALSVSPLSNTLAWETAFALDAAMLPDAANVIYDHAIALQQRVYPTQVIPGSYWMSLAINATARGELELAERRTRIAARLEHDRYAPSFMLVWLLVEQGRRVEAHNLREAIGARFAEFDDLTRVPAETLAEGAWFYILGQPDADRATELAQAAMDQMPHDPFIRRVWAWSRLSLSDDDEPDPVAVDTLRALAAHDPYAALALAQRADDRGDSVDACVLMDRCANPLRAGWLTDTYALRTSACSPDSQPSAVRSASKAAFDAFDRTLLRVPDRLDDVLLVRAVPVNPAPRVGERWQLDITVTNRARFPIELGPGAAINPVLLLSLTLSTGAESRSFPNAQTVHLDRRSVLLPGETTTVHHTLNVGAANRISQRWPQRLVRVTVSALFDPQQDAAGVWAPGPLGAVLQPFSLNRVPSGTSAAELSALFGRLTNPSPVTRIHAVFELAALLGEHQNHKLSRLPYTPDPIPEDRLARALRASLESESPALRAATLLALNDVGWDRELLQAIERRLTDSEWIVRLAAVELMGTRRGRDFAARASQVATADAHPLVRDLASSFADRASDAR